MTPNRRIFLNIVATYGRSLYALVIGLFCGRWTLMALGEVDYGLYGLVGGLTAFVVIANNILAVGISRFYAISIGKMRVNENVGLLETRKWFTTAVIIHTILPVLLVAIGYPIGSWCIKTYLAIPSDSHCACLWLWRFSCASCFLGMVSCPFVAMYTAKQEIAEMTVYSLFFTTLTCCFSYYMVTNPCDHWLVTYGGWMFVMTSMPLMLMSVRAVCVYHECRMVMSSVNEYVLRVSQLLRYSAWLTFGFLGGLFRGQGISLLVNKVYGPIMNASLTVGNGLSMRSDTLAQSLTGAFSPAIMNAYGSGDIDSVRVMANRASKFGTLCLMLFALPMILEVDSVLKIWLHNPPAHANKFCICFLLSSLIDRTAVGQMIAVNATGRVAGYQSVSGTCLIAALPMAYLLCVQMKMGVWGIGYALIVSMMVCAWGRVWFARSLIHMSICKWFSAVFAPLSLVFVVAFVAGLLPRLFMENSLGRSFVSCVSTIIAMTFASWACVLDSSEKDFLLKKLKQRAGAWRNF